jgi:hypothetical protein
VLPDTDFFYEAEIPYKASGHLVKIETHPGEGGSHNFGIADGEVGTEVDLLVYNDKHGKIFPLLLQLMAFKGESIADDGIIGFWVCPEVIAEGEGEVFILFYGRHPVKANLPSDECQPVRLHADAL